jgi:hypothetical protein
MKRCCWAGLVLMGCMSSAGAEPASTQSVEKLLQLTQAQMQARSMRMYAEPMLRQMVSQAIVQQTSGKPLTQPQRQAEDKLNKQVNELFNTELSWDKLEPQVVSAYTQVFEQKEIDDILAFYQSPSGQALLHKMPLVTKRIAGSGPQAAPQIVAALAPKVQQLAKEAFKEKSDVKEKSDPK